jgi:hypothetical protein
LHGEAAVGVRERQLRLAARILSLLAYTKQHD